MNVSILSSENAGYVTLGVLLSACQEDTTPNFRAIISGILILILPFSLQDCHKIARLPVIHICITDRHQLPSLIPELIQFVGQFLEIDIPTDKPTSGGQRYRFVFPFLSHLFDFSSNFPFSVNSHHGRFSVVLKKCSTDKSV